MITRRAAASASMKNLSPRSTRERNVWLFNSGDSFTGNPKWMFLYVALHREDIEAHWICDDPGLAERVRSLGFDAVTFAESKDLQRRAGVFVVNQVKEHIPEAMTGITLLNLWHGVGVKSIERGMNEGYLRERIAKKYIVNNQAYRDTQLFLVSSPAMEEHFSRYIGLDDDVIIRGGYPQNEYRRRFGAYSSFDHDLRGRRGLPASTRIAMYSPTPRRDFRPTFLFDAFPDIPRLLERLEQTDTLLIVKMHPHMTNDPVATRLRAEYADEPRLMFWDNAEDAYEIFEDVDLAIVDYSSILYDQLAAGVTKVIRYVFDYEDGDNAVLQEGTDYMELSVGTVANDFDELLDALGQSNDVAPTDLERINAYFWDYADDHSFEAITDKALAFEARDVHLPVLYSFDVFDTVMHRRGVRPVSVFHYVQQKIRASDVAFPAELVTDYVTLRRQAESAMREFHRKDPSRTPLDYEITYADLLGKLGRVMKLDERQLELLQQWEFEGELLSVIPDDAMIDHIKQLKRAGETVVLISDMYLPREQISAMLAAADPMLAELPLYLSNVEHAQKTTKTLFLRVYDDLGYDFARWEHTGDNTTADVKRPRELGISTTQVPMPKFVDDEVELVDMFPTFDSHLVAGMLRDHRVSEPTSAEAFAMRRIALYLVPYVSWVVRDAVERGYEKLYFISRDGHHMRRIADVLIEAWNLPLETEYVYASRRVWRLASQADEMEAEFFSGFGNFAGVKSMAGLLRTGRIEEADLARFAPHLAARIATLAPDQRDDRELLAEVIAALSESESYHDHLKAIAAEDRRLALRYTKDHVDLASKFAFVEYWGRGYTQDCLVKILASDGYDAPVPFYYARSIYPTQGQSVRYNFTMATYSLLFIEAIFANLPYGTVERYEERGGEVVPVTSPRQYDEELFRATERVLPEFAARYAALPVVDRSEIDRNLLTFGVRHFQSHFRDDDYVTHLASLRDSVELSGQEREFAPKLTLPRYVAFLRGARLGVTGVAWQMSLVRASPLVRGLDFLQRNIGFRRFVKKFQNKRARSGKH